MQSANAAKEEAHKKADAMLHAAGRLEKVVQIVSSASTQLAAQIEQSDKGAAQAAQRLAEAATAMNQMMQPCRKWPATLVRLLLLRLKPEKRPKAALR